ncbi:MAG: F0F1 ATP synthase subunit B [Magnetococcales bacterium]|nr:F0F1 ATP synthase subunit B [Magnetococcales bacterium]
MIATAHASSGLPQFDATFFQSQMFWTVVSFVILMLLLNKYVIPAIGALLDARGRRIEDDLTAARRAREEAEALLANYRSQLDGAWEAAAKTAEEARQEAARYREESLAALKDEMDRKKGSALEEIEQAKRKAMSEVKDAAVELAMLATEKLVAKSVTKTEANKMVQEALTMLQEDGRQLN